MKIKTILISLTFLGACSGGTDKSAKDIAKENGDNYCKCLSEDVKKGGIGMECYHEALNNFEKAMDAGKFEGKDLDDAKSLFKNICDKCNAENNLGGGL